MVAMPQLPCHCCSTGLHAMHSVHKTPTYCTNAMLVQTHDVDVLTDQGNAGTCHTSQNICHTTGNT